LEAGDRFREEKMKRFGKILKRFGKKSDEKQISEMSSPFLTFAGLQEAGHGSV
jgi:hypothetical protein